MKPWDRTEGGKLWGKKAAQQMLLVSNPVAVVQQQFLTFKGSPPPKHTDIMRLPKTSPGQKGAIKNLAT